MTPKKLNSLCNFFQLNMYNRKEICSIIKKIDYEARSEQCKIHQPIFHSYDALINRLQKALNDWNRGIT